METIKAVIVLIFFLSIIFGIKILIQKVSVAFRKKKVCVRKTNVDVDKFI